ncbi:MAG: hypothetical protein WCQ44_04270, partial [Opitutaceae bacterium]
MRTVIAAPTQTLISLSNDELIALSNCLNEVINNSDIDERDCGTRVGVSLNELRNIHSSIKESLAMKRADSTELFQMWRDGFSLQLKAISAFGDPADLSFAE